MMRKVHISARSLLVIGLDLFFISFSFWLAHQVRSQLGDPLHGHFAADRLVPLIIAAVPILFWRRLSAIHPRYMGLYDLMNVGGVMVMLGLFARLNEQRLRPELTALEGWNMVLLFIFFGGMFLAGWRLLRRIYAMRVLHFVGQAPCRRRMLIIGACDEGEALYRELSRDPRHDTVVLGFVDEDPHMKGQTLHGLPVLSGIDDLPEVMAKHNVNEIMVAKPDLPSEQITKIFRMGSEAEARVRIIPSFSAIIQGDASCLISMARDIDVQDLLRRESVKSDSRSTDRYIAGESILVTGGGGSIGSELARQASKHSPASVILLGKGEGSIFETEQELRQTSTLRPIPIICDVRDPKGLEYVFKTQSPSVVFHAAAHKHVPLMEQVPIEAIRNNVIGTLNVAQAAIHHHAKKFVLVSTDKAVNPSNVMGATKRVSEMIIQALANQSDTAFAAVRFGNVLGSRGSLVPLIKKQIQRGGPVTITHWDMTRYFMTIPEASDLILQAGAMGREGEIFVLDMGEPVKIIDLIRDMIRMHSLVPGQDIEIKCIGVRPGEKIHEELYFAEEDVTHSSHPKIHKVVSNPVPYSWLKHKIEELEEICDQGDQDKARQALMALAWAKDMPPVPLMK